MKTKGCIGIFDSGYGGLTVLEKIYSRLPEYDYLYLGDNARAPYGSYSFNIIYKCTLQAVKRLFTEGCHLVILACNTASSSALRVIQQKDLITLDPTKKKRVLGIIRPTIEIINKLTKTGHVGVFGTESTIYSKSYFIEIQRLFPNIIVTEEACPMWASLVENAEYNCPSTDYFIQRHIHSIMNIDPLIDTLILACTHYPLLKKKIKKYLPRSVSLISQGEYVADSLAKYLSLHSEVDSHCSKQGTMHFYTTQSAEKFMITASIFLRRKIEARHIIL